MTFPIPNAALEQHTAILGKTGSGKTTTAKLMVEHLTALGNRVCVLDPIKSDWWGLISSADGRHAGLPFHILGGPRGHVPLHASSGKVIAELVANASLPHAIMDMAFFEPGGQSRFFIDFASTLLRKMRGVLYLVLEEAHLFAPKERSGLGDENMAIHWAKMLATAGRSKGIRLILVTQRTQALHNALLGSCDTMIAHRLTAPADQDPVVKWLKANVDKETTTRVASSLSSLKTGTAWVCSGEAKLFEQVVFPRIKTYDNSATPTGDLETVEVRTTSVDLDKLRALVGDAVKEAEASDPKALKAQVADLTRRLASAASSSATPQQIKSAQDKGYELGCADGHEQGFKDGARAMRDEYFSAWEAAKVAMGESLKTLPKYANPMHAPVTQLIENRVQPGDAGLTPARRSNGEDGVALRSSAHPVGTGKMPRSRLSKGSLERVEIELPDLPLTGPQRTVLGALAWWKEIGHSAVTRAQLAAKAGFKVSGGHFLNRLSELARAEYIEYPRQNYVAMTLKGSKVAPKPDIGLSVADSIRETLTGPQAKLFDVLLRARDMSREELAEETAFEPKGGHFLNRLSELSRMEIITFPERGQVALQDWVV